jgi:hypothetical protein
VKERIKRGGYKRGLEERTIIPQNEKSKRGKMTGYKRENSTERSNTRNGKQQTVRQQQAQKKTRDRRVASGCELRR